jgi:hypothetical protein
MMTTQEDRCVPHDRRNPQNPSNPHNPYSPHNPHNPHNRHHRQQEKKELSVRFQRELEKFAFDLSAQLGLNERDFKHDLTVRVFDTRLNVVGRLPLLLQQILLDPTQTQKEIIKRANIEIAERDLSGEANAERDYRPMGSANEKNLRLKLTAGIRKVLLDQLSDWLEPRHRVLLASSPTLSAFHSHVKHLNQCGEDFSVVDSGVIFEGRVQVQLTPNDFSINGVRLRVSDNKVKGKNYRGVRVTLEGLRAALVSAPEPGTRFKGASAAQMSLRLVSSRPKEGGAPSSSATGDIGRAAIGLNMP